MFNQNINTVRHRLEIICFTLSLLWANLLMDINFASSRAEMKSWKCNSHTC